MNLTDLKSTLPDLVATTRLNSRHLATLALFFHSKGETPRSTSELIRLSVESLAEVLILNNEADFVSNLDEAHQVLERLGLTGKIQKTNLQKLLKSNLQTAPLGKGLDPKGSGGNAVSLDPQTKEALRLLEESLKNSKEDI